MLQAGEMTFNDIYNNYSAALYGIILKLSKNTRDAEDILIASFRSFMMQQTLMPQSSCIFQDLLRITIPIVAKKVNLTEHNIGRIIITEASELKGGRKYIV